MQQLHYISARSYKDIYISICGVKTDGADLPAHSIYSNTHITRMLSHHKAIVLIQIKHGVFDCKVHKQKRHVKVGLFRMVTVNLLTGVALGGQQVLMGWARQCAKRELPHVWVGARVAIHILYSSSARGDSFLAPECGGEGQEDGEDFETASQHEERQYPELGVVQYVPRPRGAHHMTHAGTDVVDG